jgi:radical SAM-linked protein
MQQTTDFQYQLHCDLKKRKLKFKWQDAPLSFMEGVFARGDRRLATVLIRAVELGCRFDGWREHFSLERWLQACADCGIDPEWYLRRRELDEILPWQHLDCGVTREFLLAERERARAEAVTKDCRDGSCSACGVCDFTVVTNKISDQTPIPPRPNTSAGEQPAARMRLRFAKAGVMRYLSHLELITVFTRAVSRGDVPILFSLGFHPHPRFSFGTATSVGVDSQAEYMDMFVVAGITAAEVQNRLNSVLPDGLRILDAEEVDAKSPSISTQIDATRYRITITDAEPERLQKLCEQFLALDSFVITRTKKGQTQTVDLRNETVSLAANHTVVELVARRGKPVEFARAISGNSELQGDDIQVEKLEVIFAP